MTVDTTELEVFHEHGVLEVLPVVELQLVEVITPGPAGTPGDPGTLALPFGTPFMRIKLTGELQIFNPDQNKFHTLLAAGLAGAEYITIGAGET